MREQGLELGSHEVRTSVSRFEAVFGEMGQSKSKAQRKMLENSAEALEGGIPEIPQESPLGWMLEHWE